MAIPVQIKTDNAPAYVPSKIKQLLHIIKHITGMPHNPTGQAVVERFNHTLRNAL